jgi:hypothetical protein
MVGHDELLAVNFIYCIFRNVKVAGTTKNN